MVNNGRFRVGFAGGFGEVALARIMVEMFYNIPRQRGRMFELECIADTQDGAEIRQFICNGTIDNFVEETLQSRIGRAIPEQVKDILSIGLGANGVKYFNVEGKTIPDEFFDNIDVFVIASPHPYHVPQLLQCVDYMNRTGRTIHLLPEKPVAGKMGEAISALEYLDEKEPDLEKKVVLMDVEHYCHYSSVRYIVDNLKREIEDKHLGKIKSIECTILEDDNFENERNQNIVNREVSGGGYWLDIGVHVVAFLRAIGAKVDFFDISAQGYKIDDPNIRGDKYLETAMIAKLKVEPSEHYAENCYAHIKVAKACSEKRKRFHLTCENGEICADIVDDVATIVRIDATGNTTRSVGTTKTNTTPYYHAIEAFYDAIAHNKPIPTSFRNGLRDVVDVNRVYEKSGKLLVLSVGEYLKILQDEQSESDKAVG